jgi:hypothetical protein
VAKGGKVAGDDGADPPRRAGDDDTHGIRVARHTSPRNAQ